MSPTAGIPRVALISSHAPARPAHGPSAWDDAPEPIPDWGLVGQPGPDVEFDQRIA